MPTVKMPVVEYGSDYGAWGVVQGILNETSSVLSFGVGTDASFDLALIQKYGLKLQAFDPTPRSAEWVASKIKDDRFVFHPYAISDQDGELEFFLPSDSNMVSGSIAHREGLGSQSFRVKALSPKSVYEYLKIQAVDYMKMDIEGAEYSVIPKICELERESLPKQLAIEFHHFFPNLKNEDTLDAVRLLKKQGYRIAWSSGTTHEVLFTLSEPQI